jgi:aryl-alcohol dehydrogenase-like predicted oxidoreductase
MSADYGLHDDEASTATFQRGIELGITFFDTSDAYGLGHNEELIGRRCAATGKTWSLIL